MSRKVSQRDGGPPSRPLGLPGYEVFAEADAQRPNWSREPSGAKNKQCAQDLPGNGSREEIGSVKRSTYCIFHSYLFHNSSRPLLFAYSVTLCWLLPFCVPPPYVELTRACTTLLSTPQCWKCRPWWLSSRRTSATQEIPWRMPRRSARGQDGHVTLNGFWQSIILCPKSAVLFFSPSVATGTFITKLISMARFDCVCMRGAIVA